MKLIRLGALCGLLITLVGANAPRTSTTIIYDIVTNGTINGSSVVTIDPEGAVAIDNRYQNQDKERSLNVAVSLDPSGIPVTMLRKGQAFAFAPIDESFSRQGSQASWQNRVEKGASSEAASRYYVPFGLTFGSGPGSDGAAYELGLLAAALLKAPGGQLDLLPTGTAHAKVVDETVISRGDDQRRLRLVSITGTSLDPIYVWLDDDDRLFAGGGAIRRGWAEFEPRLAGLVGDADERLIDDAVRRARLSSSPESIVIHDVSVFDSRSGKVLPHRTVTIDGGQIQSVSSARRQRPSVKGRLIDGRGMTLLPGLWDMHVHLQPREPLRQLATGVTTVRDMGSANARLDRIERRVRTGLMPGPAILRAGFMDASGPNATYTGILVSSEADALAAVDRYADAGFVQIKLYNAIRPEWIPAIARRTHERGMRLSGHVSFGSTVQQVTAAGFDEIQHFVYPLLGIDGHPAETPLTFNTAKAAQDLDLDGKAARDFIGLMRARDVTFDMTLSVYEPLIVGQTGVVPPVMAAWMDRLPAAMLRQATGGPMPTPPDLTTEQFRTTFAKAQALMLALHRGQVSLVAGTDQAWIGGLAFPRELELMVVAGLSPADALSIATYRSAKTMGQEETVGQVAAGQRADLVLVSGDPTRDISRIRAVKHVIKSGKLYRPDDLFDIALDRASGHVASVTIPAGGHVAAGPNEKD